MMHRIHIVGRKNSGKTTLIVDLVRYLTEKGHHVGTIKHTHHHHEFDTPGKDSHCHREAGAVVVGILAPAMSVVFSPNKAETVGERRYEEIDALFSDCDLVLVEGDASSTAAKIEVWRSDNPQEPLALNDSSIIAVVTDDPVDVSTTVWPRSDVAALAQRILERVESLKAESPDSRVQS